MKPHPMTTCSTDCLAFQLKKKVLAICHFQALDLAIHLLDWRFCPSSQIWASHPLIFPLSSQSSHCRAYIPIISSVSLLFPNLLQFNKIIPQLWKPEWKTLLWQCLLQSTGIKVKRPPNSHQDAQLFFRISASREVCIKRSLLMWLCLFIPWHNSFTFDLWKQ